MKVRVVDVFKSGLRWEFVPSGTENVSTDQGQRLNFPPVTELLSAAIKRNPVLKDSNREFVLPPSSSSRPDNDNGGGGEEQAISPPRQPLPFDEETPQCASDLLPQPAATIEPTPPPSKEDEEPAAVQKMISPPPLHQRPSPPPVENDVVATAVVMPPPGFEIEIEAPLPPPLLPAAAAAAVAGIEKDDGVDVSAGAAAGGAFDYFTATQLCPTQQHTDPHYAWAVGLPPPPPLLAPQQQQPLAAPSTRMENRFVVKNNGAPPPPPQTGFIRSTTTTTTTTTAPTTLKRNRFAFSPEEAAANRAKLSKITEELGAIWKAAGDTTTTNDDEDTDTGSKEEDVPPLTVQVNNKTRNSEHHPTDHHQFIASGFQTAAGKGVLVDAEKVAAAQRILASSSPPKQQQQVAGDGDDGRDDDSRNGKKEMRTAELEMDERTGNEGRVTFDCHPTTTAPPPVFVGFSTGNGKTVNIDAAKLARAKRIFEEEPEKEATHANAASPAFVGFETGNGKRVKIDPEKLARGQRLLADVDVVEVVENVDNDDAMAQGSSTPHMMRAVARTHQHAHAHTPVSLPPKLHHHSTHSTATHSTAAVPRTALPPAKPSRLGPQVPTINTTTTTTTTTTKKKGRGKFHTPRPIAPHRVISTDDGSGLSVMKTPSGAGIKQKFHQNSYSTPLHDLSSSVLKAARATLGCSTVSPPPPPPSDWCSHLPLDSLNAATYVFGGEVDCVKMQKRLLDAGANPDYASEDWTRNHYRWVVWKLARAEFAAGPSAAGRLLTAAAAEDELRCRYEREFNHGHRPWLKAVLQHDASSAELAVLLVASIRKMESSMTTTTTTTTAPPAMLELTDGWYWIMAHCDAHLTQLIHQGSIHPGTKIRISGAELVAAAPGDPLDAARSAVLKLHANGVHPVSSSSSSLKLGKQAHRLSYVPLGAVHPSGGTIPQTVVVVLRRYPRLMWTKLPSGVATFQTPRAQATAEQRLHAELTQARTAAAAQVQSAEVRRCKEWLTVGKRGGGGEGAGMSQVDRWYAAMVAGDGSDEFLQSLNASDRAVLERYALARRGELEVETQRATEAALAADVPGALAAGSTEAAMVLVGEMTHEGTAAGREVSSGQRHPAHALVTIWRPSEDVAAMKEGEIYAVTGLEPSASNNNNNSYRSTTTNTTTADFGVLLPDAALQLEAGPRCHWRKLASSVADLYSTPLTGHAMPRAVPVLTELGAIASAESRRGAVFDFTGVLLKAGPLYPQLGNALYPQYQWVFLADASVESTAGGGGGGAVHSSSWLLAVRLQGHQDALTWMDAANEGCVVSLSDLELLGRDEAPRMWRAAGGKHSAVAVISNSGGGGGARRGRNGCSDAAAAAAVTAWVKESPDVVKALQARVEALLST